MRAKTIAERFFVVAAGVFLALCGGAARAQTPVYDVEIVRSFPHDPSAFTQGLFYLDGFLYESTGLKGQSSLRKVEIETGAVLSRQDLAPEIFGEGITLWKGKVIGLTWRSQVGFVYELDTFREIRRFTYPGEGWGITANAKTLIMSDGTSALRFLDPRSFKELRRVSVTHQGKLVEHLNELEWIEGEVFANVWKTDLIVRIDPKSGKVVGVIDLRSLRAALGESAGAVDVLNGVAYDAKSRRLFVTGKNWPTLFEIKLVERQAPAN